MLSVVILAFSLSLTLSAAVVLASLNPVSFPPTDCTNSHIPVSAQSRRKSHRRGETPCGPRECDDMFDACHQYAIRACQVGSRRRDSCLEKFARKCQIVVVQCEYRCMGLFQDPDDDDKVSHPRTHSIP